MNKLISSAMVVGLLFAAASCSSDKDSSSTTAASTVETTGGSTAAASGTLADQALAATVAAATAAGVTVDEACVATVIAKLSEADQQLIVDGPTNGTVTLSSAGEALSPEVQACVAAAPETTPGT